MKKTATATGFGVKAPERSKGYGTEWSYKKQKLLALIVSKLPESRKDLGMQPDERLNWEYGGWTPEMVKSAHKVLDKWQPKLPARSMSTGFQR